MNDDEMLKQLGAAARAEREEDPRWEKLTLGIASDAERAELAALEGDLAASHREHYRRLDARALDRIAARVTPGTATANAPSKHRRATWFRRAAIAVGPLALAAGVALWVSSTPTDTWTLPGYEVAAAGGEQALRGPAMDGVTVVHLGAHDTRIEIIVRPQTSTHDVEGHAFALREGGLTPLAMTAESSSDGAVRLVGTSSTLDGATAVCVLVGHPRALGDATGRLAKVRRGGSDTGWQVLKVDITR